MNKKINFCKIAYDVYFYISKEFCGTLAKEELIRLKEEWCKEGIPLYLVDEEGKIVKREI